MAEDDNVDVGFDKLYSRVESQENFPLRVLMIRRTCDLAVLKPPVIPLPGTS